MGLVGFAIFLVVSAIVVILNPGFFQDLWTWWRPLLTEAQVVRPPDALIVSAIIFFGLNGLAGFVIAYLRLAIRRQRTRALADTLSATGTIAFTVLLAVYLERILPGSLVLAILVGMIGVLILAYFVLAIALGLVPELMRREEARVTTRR
jgi:hypothetical protein